MKSTLFAGLNFKIEYFFFDSLQCTTHYVKPLACIKYITELELTSYNFISFLATNKIMHHILDYMGTKPHLEVGGQILPFLNLLVIIYISPLSCTFTRFSHIFLEKLYISHTQHVFKVVFLIMMIPLVLSEYNMTYNMYHRLGGSPNLLYKPMR